ncbi:MAG: ABC transporter permease [Candidatus Methanodesulfokora sp.]
MTPLEIAEISLRSIAISGTASIIAAVISIPLSLFLCFRDFKGKNLILEILNSMVSLPTVVIGLLLYYLLTRTGPLGFLDLMYTPIAMVIGQAILIIPLMTIFMERALDSRKDVVEVAISLGASNSQAAHRLFLDSLPGIISSVLVGFNRAIGELGVALMLGGNIKGFTRVMTTAIALEVSKGEFELGISLGFILVCISLLLTSAISRMARR